MSESKFFKQNWKLLLNIVTALGLVVLAYFIRSQLKSTLVYLTKANSFALLLMIPLQVGNYHAQTRLTQGIFRLLGSKVDYRPLYVNQLELNFVNTVFPSNGVSGASYFAARMKSTQDISVGQSSFVYTMKLALTFIGFEVLLIIGVLLLALGGHVNDFVISAATFATTLLFVLLFLFVYVIGSKTRVVRTFRGLSIFFNRIIQIFRPKHPETINLNKLEAVVNDFHENYKLFRSKYRDLAWPLWYGFLNTLTEVLTIYVVYIAFGRWVNPGSIIIAYSLANFAGFLSVLPSGVGMYEAIMTGVLVATGIPARLSLPVTITYRVLNTLIQIPPGYFFYRRALKTNKQSNDAG